ncbi:MAG: spore germination protein [Firmicutes bacterium]|nr:spore germination protein [Bacillota bacterium]MDY5856746.1 spore germination protein [Anaerovoracaceae bacterium]
MYEKYLRIMEEELPLGESFDLLEREITIGGRKGTLFFVDGLTDGELMQRVMDYLMKVQPGDMEGVVTSSRFIAGHLPFLDASLAAPEKEEGQKIGKPQEWTQQQICACCRKAQKQLYAGLVPLLIEDLDQIIILDARSYPSRSVEEPEKEKSLRGARDGFTESIMENIALIRRRLRNHHLIFQNFTIGGLSKTDVAMAYIKGKADKTLLQRMENLLKKLEQEADLDALTVGDQTLLEQILMAAGKKGRHAGRFNPFPKVRYSQRPDIIAAHIAEGKIALIVDNSPTVMLLPVGIFDFLQDVDDYYFPQLTGNYFRLLRTLNFIVILFLTPVYLLLVNDEVFNPDLLLFFVPDEPFAIPLIWQFLLLEIAVDGLKLASLNTPQSLGMSLSVIGALILGEFSIESGWFIPQTILCMAVVALASFTQPSIELSYGVKFTRIIMLIGTYLLGLGGMIAGAAVSFAVVAVTRTLSGGSYLYPLIPFRWNALKRLLFRTRV